MIEKFFCDPHVIARLRRPTPLADGLDLLATHLHRRGHALVVGQDYLRAAAHLGHWMRIARVPLAALREEVVARFLEKHIPRCRCPIPRGLPLRVVRASLGHLVATLRSSERIPLRQTSERTPSDIVVAEYRQYLCEMQGAAQRTIDTYSQLLLFAKYVDEMGHRGPVTTELALRWATLPTSVTQEYRSRRLGIVRRFAKHRFLFDPETEVPPDRLLCPPCRRPTPYIYSDSEIGALIQACTQLGPPGGLRPIRYATFFGLLSSTGLRSAEALRLNKPDVDLQTGIVCVTKSKVRKSRLVPLHPSTTRALRAYAAQRDRRHSLSLEHAFFLTEKGTPLKYGKMFATFQHLRRKVNP